MASRYPSQTETTNFARLSRLVLDVCSDVLRDVLDTHIPPPGLHAILKRQKDRLKKELQYFHVSILYPPGNVFSGTLKGLDFSLLYSLVRNIQGVNISPHTKGWGKEPDATDRSLAANIDRLRDIRNKAFGHLPKASLSDTDFGHIWGIIRQCVSEIEQGTLTGDTYVREVDNLLTLTMDPDTEKKLIQRLQEQQVEFETVVEGLTAEQKAMAAIQESMARDIKEMKEIHPDLKPMIETTINRIRIEKEKKFLETKAFHDAQVKLRMNRVLVIKGNTGDGKTSTAFQLLHWLTNEQQSRKPLQLHEIKKLDLLAPNSNLVCIIDDIFGEKDISKSDEGEWNKRLKHVETLFVDKQNQANILLITIRNEIYNALTKQSRGTVFTEENIVDLSSDKYKIKEEKQKLLAMYTPENFSWKEKEMTKILGCKLHIGFPQCCHLFSKSGELQKKGAEFFENPFQFFKDALSKLPQCYAILFLFLNNGEIKVNDLDPNEDKVDKTLLEQAFRIKLVNSEDRTKREYEEKVDFVRESLDKLLGFLVKKEEHSSGEEVYRFDHDSIYVTVALLYGKKTPVGYIKHCPRKALRYLTTVETSTDMVVISSRHYNDLCERLLREFERVERYDDVIDSLNLWTEPVILEIFDKYLDEKKVNKLNILNKACQYGSAELALYLLKKGVKPDEDTDWWILIRRGRGYGKGYLDILEEIVAFLNDKMKQDLLNEACKRGVKPDEYTMLHVVEGGSVDLYNTVRQYGVTPTERDEDGRNALHWACKLEAEFIAGLLCVDYPHLVHDTDMFGLTPLHMAAWTGNCSIFQTVEKTVLKSLCRVEDEQHQCEREEDCLVHRHCVCSQYMCQFVGGVGGRTVLHDSCRFRHKDLCVYICRTYPAMTACVDSEGWHCLHYIAECTRYIDIFIEIESYVRKHMQTLKQYYDIKTILNGRGESVLDLAKERKERLGEWNPLYDHLVGVFSK